MYRKQELYQVKLKPAMRTALLLFVQSLKIRPVFLSDQGSMLGQKAVNEKKVCPGSQQELPDQK
jgi:hypothetical protein